MPKTLMYFVLTFSFATCENVCLADDCVSSEVGTTTDLTNVAPRSATSQKSGSVSINKASPTRSGIQTAMMFLPFGAAQFQNKSWALGTISAFVQSNALYFWYQQNRSADRLVEESNSNVEQSKSEPGYSTDVVYQQRVSDYAEDSDKTITHTREQAQTGLYVFAGMWAVSVVEGFLHRSSGSDQRLAPKASVGYEPKKGLMLVVQTGF